MIKYCKEMWTKNEHKLKESILKHKNMDDLNYLDIVKLTVENILNYNGDIEWNIDNITEIDNGDYQGTLLYLIPSNTYQPDESEYLITYVGYGSCSGCDTLQSIQYDSVSEEEKLTDYITLCRDIVCNMIKPYNNGWRHDVDFDTVAEDIK